MPYEVSVEHASRTIVVVGYGQGTTDDTLQLIAEQTPTFRAHPGYNLLYDATGLEIESSPADMLKVANALLDQSGAAFGRIALVVPENREPLARMFTALAHPHGISANVFGHVADARHWLGIAD